MVVQLQRDVQPHVVVQLHGDVQPHVVVRPHVVVQLHVVAQHHGDVQPHGVVQHHEVGAVEREAVVVGAPPVAEVLPAVEAEAHEVVAEELVAPPGEAAVAPEVEVAEIAQGVEVVEPEAAVDVVPVVGAVVEEAALERAVEVHKETRETQMQIQEAIPVLIKTGVKEVLRVLPDASIGKSSTKQRTTSDKKDRNHATANTRSTS